MICIWVKSLCVADKSKEGQILLGSRIRKPDVYTDAGWPNAKQGPTAAKQTSRLSTTARNACLPPLDPAKGDLCSVSLQNAPQPCSASWTAASVDNRQQTQGRDLAVVCFAAKTEPTESEGTTIARLDGRLRIEAKRGAIFLDRRDLERLSANGTIAPMVRGGKWAPKRGTLDNCRT
ncbi:hypothetical protein GQ53DRAFT_802203 [Thozetella sp. PMI_491]|nr:hypothetical protein GQ53DRAFT_802203 [Thozetella sp. PMI_491]